MRGTSGAALAFLAMLSSCAILSGLDRLTIEESADASMDGSSDVADVRGMSDATVEAADATGIPDANADAGEAGDASSIRCGAGSCPASSECCNVVTLGIPSVTCVKAGTCTGSNHYVMACDEVSCPSKQKCCVTLQGVSPLQYATSASCTATCSGQTTAPLCKTTADCNFGTCKASYGLTGYQTCGP